MTAARAPYLEWAKTRPEARIDLARSDLLACPIEELVDAAAALDLSGGNADGYPPLLEAVAGAAGVSPDRVATAGGCAGANFLVLAAVVRPGDGVLVESPTYDPLPAAVETLGGHVTPFQRRFEEGYALDLDAVARGLRDGARVVVLTNPHNPSGVLVEEETLRELAALLDARGGIAVVDEVYREAVAPPHPAVAATLAPVLVSTSSLTKAYGLSPLRCGWAVASPELAARIRRARDIVDGSGALPAEKLSVLAFAALDRLAARARGLLEPNRRLWEEFFAKIDTLECVRSAAPLAFPRFRDRRDAGPFAHALFERHGVAVVAGRFFGAPDQFRVSLGGATGALEEGLEVIGKELGVGI